MKRSSRPPERPARAAGLSQTRSKGARSSQGRPAITSARAPSRLRRGRLVAMALVVAAALGAGVLFRDRLVAPPSTAPDQPRTVLQPTTAAVSEPTAQPLSVAQAETPSAQAPATAPTSAPVAEPTSASPAPVAEPTSASAAEPRAQSPTPAAEPVSEPSGAPAEAVSSSGEPAAEPVGRPAAEPAAQSATPPAEPTPEPTAVAEVGLPTGAQASAPAARTGAQAPAPAPAVRRPATRTYTVQPRDTLKGIAARYGVSIASILAINTIPNPDSLVVGQVLTIPPAR